jgi:hypothetical protein
MKNYLNYIMNTKEIKTYASGNLDLALDRHTTVTGLMTTNMFHLSETLPDPYLIHDLSPGL